MLDSWKQGLRDEIYLIGEQLHNHGERHPPPASTTTPATNDVSNIEMDQPLIPFDTVEDIPAESTTSSEKTSLERDLETTEFVDDNTGEGTSATGALDTAQEGEIGM